MPATTPHRGCWTGRMLPDPRPVIRVRQGGRRRGSSASSVVRLSPKRSSDSMGTAARSAIPGWRLGMASTARLPTSRGWVGLMRVRTRSTTCFAYARTTTSSSTPSPSSSTATSSYDGPLVARRSASYGCTRSIQSERKIFNIIGGSAEGGGLALNEAQRWLARLLSVSAEDADVAACRLRTALHEGHGFGQALLALVHRAMASAIVGCRYRLRWRVAGSASVRCSQRRPGSG